MIARPALRARAGFGLHGHSASFAARLDAGQRAAWRELIAAWRPPVIDTAANYQDEAGQALHPWLAELLEAMAPARPRIVNKIGAGWTRASDPAELVAGAEAILPWVGAETPVEHMLYAAPSDRAEDLVAAHEVLAGAGFELSGISIVLPRQLEVVEAAIEASGLAPRVLQFPFNPVDSAAGLEILAWCRRTGVEAMARSMLASGLLGDAPWRWADPLADPLRARFWAKPENEAILAGRLAARARIETFLAAHWPGGLAGHGFAACVAALTLGHPDLGSGLFGGRLAAQTARLVAVLEAGMPEDLATRFWADAAAWQAPFFR